MFGCWVNIKNQTLPIAHGNPLTLHQKTSQSHEMNEASARGKNNEIQNPKGRGVNLSIIFDEIACWRMYFSWPGALTAILLGLAPSAWDVSSDYVYAQTWYLSIGLVFCCFGQFENSLLNLICISTSFRGKRLLIRWQTVSE